MPSMPRLPGQARDFVDGHSGESRWADSGKMAAKHRRPGWALDTVETRDAKMNRQTNLGSFQANCRWKILVRFQDTVKSSPNRFAPSMIAMESAEATPL